MTRAKSVRGIQSFNQSVNRGRVAQYPEARSRTFSWILGHGYWDTHLTRVLWTWILGHPPHPNSMRVPILTSSMRVPILTMRVPILTQYSPSSHPSSMRVPILTMDMDTGTPTSPEFYACPNTHQFYACPNTHHACPNTHPILTMRVPILTLLGGLANQFDDFARGPCARYSGVLVRFQVPGGKKDQDRARDENEQAEQHGDSQ